MAETTTSLIEELRLRRWAREHYVPLEQRDPTWHPVVLEEMLRKDAEMRSAPTTGRSPVCLPFVPLPPDDRHGITVDSPMARPWPLPRRGGDHSRIDPGHGVPAP